MECVALRTNPVCHSNHLDLTNRNIIVYDSRVGVSTIHKIFEHSEIAGNQVTIVTICRTIGIRHQIKNSRPFFSDGKLYDQQSICYMLSELLAIHIYIEIFFIFYYFMKSLSVLKKKIKERELINGNKVTSQHMHFLVPNHEPFQQFSLIYEFLIQRKTVLFIDTYYWPQPVLLIS